jgi:hypothetical protein
VMLKDDEVKLWEAVSTARPDEHGLIYVRQIGEALGIAEKRIEYLCDKWHRQQKWIRFGETTGTFQGLEEHIKSCKRFAKARELRCNPWEVPEGAL